MVKATSPCLVVPCDDTAVRLLHMLALSPPPEIKPGIYRELCALVRESLGNPEYFCTSVDKARLPAAAEALGVRVPSYAIAASVDEAQAFGWQFAVTPLWARNEATVRLANGWQSFQTPSSLRVLTRDLRQQRPSILRGRGDASILVQAHVVGKVFAQAMTAWQGAVLAGFVREKLVTHSPLGTRNRSSLRADALDPPILGSACNRPRHERFFWPRKYIVDADTGEAYLLEINRRATPATHLGGMIDIRSLRRAV